MEIVKLVVAKTSSGGKGVARDCGVLANCRRVYGNGTTVANCAAEKADTHSAIRGWREYDLTLD